MSKLRAIRAIAGIAVANTIAAANPYLINLFITFLLSKCCRCGMQVRRINAGKLPKVPTGEESDVAAPDKWAIAI